MTRQIAELAANNEALRAEIDQPARSGKRQAAPFSMGTRVKAPKLPGRKPGLGPVRYREASPPEAIIEPPMEVTITLEACPACGGLLKEERVDLTYRTELPERP